MLFSFKKTCFALLLLITSLASVGCATSSKTTDAAAQSLSETQNDTTAANEDVDYINPMDVDKVTRLLSAYEQLPPKESFDAIPGVAQILRNFAKDSQFLNQKRAAIALSYYPTEKTLHTWEDLLEKDTTDKAMRIQILALIGPTFKEEKESLSILKKYLWDADPDLRSGAAYGLGKMNTDASFQLLQDRYRVEQDPYVIDKIKKYAQQVK